MDNIRRGHHFNIRRAMERTTEKAIAQMGISTDSIDQRAACARDNRKETVPGVPLSDTLTLTNKGMHVMGMIPECGIRPRRLIRPLFILLAATASGT